MTIQSYRSAQALSSQRGSRRLSVLTPEEEPEVATPLKADACLVCICVINCLSNSGYGLVAPFLPQELKRLGISVDVYGYIFGVYSLALILCSPVIGELLMRHRRRRLIFQVGLIAMAVSMLAYATAPDVFKGKNQLIAAFIGFRFLQGFASSAIQTTCFSIVTLIYPVEHQAQVMGLLISSQSLGLTSSPVIGSALFGMGGYAYPFYVTGILFVLSTIVAGIMVPSTVDGGHEFLVSTSRSHERRESGLPEIEEEQSLVYGGPEET